MINTGEVERSFFAEGAFFSDRSKKTERNGAKRSERNINS